MDQQHFVKTKYPGYVTLVSVILLSVVSIGLLLSILLLGAAAIETSGDLVESTEARNVHDACAHEVLELVRQNINISGPGSLSIGNGSCNYDIQDISGEVGDDGGGNVISINFDDPVMSTTISDDSGNNRNFSCSATTCPTMQVAGQCNTAADFDGIDDFIEDSDGESYINGLTQFSLSMWIQSDLVGTDRGFMIGLQPNGNDDVIGLRYDDAGLYGGGDNVIKSGVTINTGSGTFVQQMESQSNVQTTAWQHIVLTWRNGDDIQLFINGVQVNPTYLDIQREGFIDGATTVLIGKGAKDTGAAGWDGRIDNFDVWDRVLTPAEIQALYTQCELNTQPNKEIQITSTVSNSVRKVRIKTLQVNPEIIVKLWEEVDAF
ncbi:MAG: hypothetical protein TR69_WS6001000626 [candidate division WS6 bacterium OLB20]|uniref:LamG-like jellyroll fold domain-containing protein n=1 Tax=candidate division WS6 bacterium OLB20 TaxID=1617426 RepID=A0A136LY90_9BACT|nr:MAG: hypothetical protein TR69_WS6001000626 [candidate division WS6 bacterium OLB20]